MIPEAANYIREYENLGFGMFIHWGLYSQIAMGEWQFHHARMTEAEYRKYMDAFTAQDWDAEAVVQMAKRAGCRYITLTTRHHDGFSLYDTCGLSDFDSLHSPVGRDLVREFVNACNKYGIVPFFYHTLLDWHHPEFEGDFNRYLDYLIASVELLCKNYGRIGGFWFDGLWSKPGADWREDELYAVIRKYQPEAIIINNSSLKAQGAVGHPQLDAITYEGVRPSPLDREGMSKYVAIEMCEAITGYWGYAEWDLSVKAPKDHILSLCASRKVGGNYLMNIGPMGQGRVEPYQEQVFAMVGRWMQLYGEAIYKGRPYDSYGMGPNFILKGDDCLYLFFYDMLRKDAPNKTSSGYHGAYSFGNVTDTITQIHWLDNGDAVDFVQYKDMLTVNTAGYPFGLNSVVRVAKAMIQ